MKNKIYSEKAIIANAQEIGLSENAIKVVMKRNLWKNKQGNIIELPIHMYRRTAKVIAGVEKKFATVKSKIKEIEADFYEMLVNRDFSSNRILKNAGRAYPHQQFAACYVFPIKDDLNDIFSTLQRSAFVQKWDAAAGIDYSTLRPKNDLVGSTGGKTSGPVSFMEVFDKMSEVISEGSLRRGANMGVLRVDHPDVQLFIDAKKEPGVLKYFNVSVGITDKFMKAVQENKDYPLINPRTKKEVKRLRAKEVWQQIMESAWRSAEPGLVFLDEIERGNPTPHIGKMTAVNLCGEQPLLPWESCILGNIVLTNFIMQTDKGVDLDWLRLAKIVRLGVRFLDNSIEANHYFYPEIEKIVKNGNRKIGLGIMAFADLLMELNVAYNSKAGLTWAGKIMKFMQNEAEKASAELAKQRGNFANFVGSTWHKKGVKHMRNACLTTVAPTGSSSVIANCSSGIEPVFALAYTRYGLGSGQATSQKKMYIVNERLIKRLKDKWLYSKELMNKITTVGSIQSLTEIPEEIKKNFVTAMDIAPEWQVKMQATFQKYVDSAISKTINLPHSATVKDIEQVYLLAWQLKCKGTTVYRDRSRQEQVLTLGKRSNVNK